MRYILPACPATGSPAVEYQVSHPSPGVALVQRRSGDGPWTDVTPVVLRSTLAAPSDLADWLRQAMGPRPAHRPRRDPTMTRIVKSYRIRPDTAEKIEQESKRTGDSQGQVIDRIVHGLIS